ncbi:hypothetical protein K458DRAFT_381820 [Lentithecium fluviatile CBS 122367]|uniref:Myb-like domain-containing protein n=1 Tax=Lentithecium fluviatile CBS 122367 TaxID=1168545 RepID=A0A6G1JP38_9PLEO|nr:hypothetical protein K458DRAFT_381820 [Lentithecium fluviatile CBS 122367]
MADTLRHHCSFIDRYTSQQEFSLSDTNSPRPFSHQQFRIPQGQAMAQPVMRQFRPEHDIHNQAWPNQRVMPRISQYPTTSAAGALTGPPAPVQRPMWSRDTAADVAFSSWPHGLPMSPMTMQEDLQLGPNSHLIYHDGALPGQNILGKHDRYGYGVGSSWALSAVGGLHRQVSAFEGSEFDTTASSLSPKSPFSDPSDPGHTVGTQNMADQMSPNTSWAGFGSASPRDIKQSQSPLQYQPNMLSFDSLQPQQIISSAGLDSNPRLPGLGTVPSVEHSPSSGNWSSEYSNQLSGPPYYQRGMLPASSFQQNASGQPSSYANYTHSDALYRSYRSDTRHEAPTQDSFQVGRTAENQAQRKREDQILIEGKANGLTYKEIRKKLGINVAESTLRGRYRSLTKARKDRVRKPVWKERDLQLLKEVVNSELDRLDDSCRALTQGQRLAKVPWKKVAEYIAEHGGSYHFGNSTCKKKWTQLHTSN